MKFIDFESVKGTKYFTTLSAFQGIARTSDAHYYALFQNDMIEITSLSYDFLREELLKEIGSETTSI